MAHILYSSRALRPSIPRKIQWSCYGEAVARLQGLCVAATAVCAEGCRPLNICNHDELVFTYY